MKLKQKMLITGVSGLLGNNLAYYFKDKYEILGLYNTHTVSIEGIDVEKCELSNPENIKRVISEFTPEIIIHCASLANIEKCEVHKNIAKQIHIIATKDLVDAVIDSEVYLIYISTDSVYDGTEGNYSENDRKINPQNYYGQSKYEGELEILRKEKSLILRTNIFGWNIQDKKSLGEWIIGELKANRRINGFEDAYFSIIYTMELARVIDIAIKKNLTGVYNCGGVNSSSKYEFARKIADCFGLDKSLINHLSIENHNFTTKRGKNLSLNIDKLQKALDDKLPTINQSIEAFYKDYKSGLPEEIKGKSSEVEIKNDEIPYARQWIDEDDIQEVVKVLSSPLITTGPKVQQFEQALAGYCGAKYAVAVNSGTSALHIACLASGIEKGNEVITSPNTFVASANCAVYCGAKPIFADIDDKTYNISPEEIKKRVTKQTKAIIPVHFAGQSCDMETVSRIVSEAERRHGNKIFIIEDASHALGSKYKGTEVGSCTYSDMATLSFHPVKHITTGEGGAVLTNDETLYEKLKSYRSHCITSDPSEFFNSNAYNDRIIPDDDLEGINQWWYYEQQELGYNYRITDIQGALGLSQLKKIDKFRKRRREIVSKYNEAFENIQSLQIPYESIDCDSNFHLYVLLFDFDHLTLDRPQLIIHLKKRGIQTQVHYIPVHTQPFYQKNFGVKWGDCPNAEDYYKKCLSIPLFPAMGEEDIKRVIDEIKKVVMGNIWK